jgi:hypothetical protein
LLIAFGSGKPPFEDDQILAVYKLFHRVLLSSGCGVKSDRTRYGHPLKSRSAKAYSSAVAVKEARGTSKA